LNGTTTQYSYDADGNRKSSTQGTTTVTSATWDGLDQLTGYTSAAGSMSGATYDDNGNRVSATFTTSAGNDRRAVRVERVQPADGRHQRLHLRGQPGNLLGLAIRVRWVPRNLKFVSGES
jgi:YD repeat-containing protein